MINDKTEIVNFIIQTFMIWLVLFTFYKLLIEKSKWLIVNRIILWTILIVPFIIPYIDFSVPSVQQSLFTTIQLPSIELSESIVKSSNYWDFYLIPTIYISIAIILLVRKALQYYSLIQQKRSREQFIYKTHRFFVIDDTIAFNLFHYLYVGENLKTIQSVLDHEIAHKKAFHSIDLLTLNIIRCTFWIFPFWNFVTQLFINNHEFYVDKKILKTVSLSDYLKQIALAGPFKFEEHVGLSSNQMSIFKTRLLMMKKNHKSQIWRYLTMLGISGFIFIACDKNSDEIENRVHKDKMQTNTPPPPPPPPLPLNPSDERSVNFAQLDVAPKFESCSDQSTKCFQQVIMKSIQENFKYPAEAKANGQEGKAYVGFNYSTKGEVVNVSLLRKTDHKLLNEEALRLIQILPKLEKPGMKDGKNVAVNYVIPINFKIKK